MKQIILASTSPRRRQLIKLLGIPFKVVASNYHEVHHKHFTPKQLVGFLAEGKAAATAKKYPNSIIVGADTIVVHKGKIFGKPKDKEDARKMLSKFSGQAQDVLTGVCVINLSAHKKVTKVVKSKLYFRKLNKQAIENLLSAGNFLDKAGAYAVQDHGAGLIRKVSGDYTNVVGLPLEALGKMLKKIGVSFS